GPHLSRDRLRALWREWQRRRLRIAAPTLLLFEVTNAIYRYERQSLLQASSADRFLRLACALPLELLDPAELHQEAIRFSRRFSLPAAYDAHYLALADHLGAEFWTADRRLVRALAGRLDWVHPAVEPAPADALAPPPAAP
ncbi:MAG: type II toxin-antitoxin system VapC family toxin, partial [Acidobacteriota bacterium]|nr:type II toxin-antitoxin system VapC family toxin [Acidobacteriota bacterium]